MSRSKPRPEGADSADPEQIREAVAGCRATALGLLARREHSRRELAHKLDQRGHDREVVGPVLDALMAEGLLDEDRYVDSYVHARSQRGYGPLRIRAELRQRGIDDGLIDAHLDGPDSGWQEAAAAAHRKRFGDGPPADLRERARRTRFLQQRGFGAEHIRRVLGGDD